MSQRKDGIKIYAQVHRLLETYFSLRINTSHQGQIPSQSWKSKELLSQQDILKMNTLIKNTITQCK